MLTNTFIVFKEFLIVSAYVSQFLGRFNCSAVHVNESVSKAKHCRGGSDENPNGTTNDVFDMRGKNGNAHKHAGEESTQMCSPIDCARPHEQENKR
jgi:hypothetical protein